MCALLPIVVILYFVSVFAQPRKHSSGYMMFLRVHFTSFFWISAFAQAAYKPSPSSIQVCFAVVAGQTLIFHYMLRLRASIGRLPNKDLNDFLVETVVKGGLRVLISVFFILFRSMKCIIEDGLQQCGTNTRCAKFISEKLILQWFLRLVHGSIKQEWQMEISLSVEKIAKLKISWRRTIQGVLLAVMAGCGAFLFALMSAKEPDEDLVWDVGLTGVSAGVVCLIAELKTVGKEQERRRTGSLLDRPIEKSTKELVDSCSLWFVAANFLATISFPTLMIMYVITSKDWTWKVATMILPMTSTCMVVAVYLRPKDEGAGIKILHLQLFLFAIGSEVAYAAGQFRLSDYSNVCFTLLRMVMFWPIAYALILKLRRRAARLPPAELSNFLCSTVLFGGVAAMAPMIFFALETLSCYASHTSHPDLSLGSDQCYNTSNAAVFLSIYLVIITAVSFANKAVSKEGRGEGLTYKNLAIMRLKKREKITGALGAVTALASMYIFSVLGVKGEYNGTIYVVGGVGAGTLGVAALIEMFVLAFGETRRVELPEGNYQAPKGGLSGASKFSSGRRLSLGRVGDDMKVAGFI